MVKKSSNTRLLVSLLGWARREETRANTQYYQPDSLQATWTKVQFRDMQKYKTRDEQC